MSDRLFSTADAAVYLGLKTVTVKKHVYITKDLESDQMVGGVLVFRQATLDDFLTRKRAGGRPRKEVIDK